MVTDIPESHQIILSSVAKQQDIPQTTLFPLYDAARKSLEKVTYTSRIPLVVKFDSESIVTVIVAETGLFITLTKTGLLTAGKAYIAETHDAVRGNVSSRFWK